MVCLVNNTSSKVSINGIRFLKHGVKDASGNYYPARYSRSVLICGRDAVTVYAKDIIKGLPVGLNPANDSDSRTDYFEKDRVRFFSGSVEFAALAPLAI